MFSSVEDIQRAGREEIIQYLEGWGFAVYDNERTEDLRDASIGCFQAEAEGQL